MDIDARAALVTGAGRGLGRELALALARRGIAVGAIDREPAGLITLAAELPGVVWELADVADAPSLAVKVALLEEQLGPIDLVIANAGVGRLTPARDFHAED